METALQGAEDYGTIEAECLRFFRDLHAQDPLFRRLDRGASNRLTVRRIFGQPASGVASSSSSAAPSRRSSFASSAASAQSSVRKPPPRQAQVAEIEPEAETEAIEDVEAEEHDGDEPASLEEVLQAEVQCLADEIAEAEEEGVDAIHLEALEQGIEASAEALVSMREARHKLAEVRKDRGFKGPSSAGPGKSKGRNSSAIAAKKASGKHVCFDCGLPEH